MRREEIEKLFAADTLRPATAVEWAIACHVAERLTARIAEERARVVRLIQHQRDKSPDTDPIQAALDEVHENVQSGWDPSYTAEADAAGENAPAEGEDAYVDAAYKRYHGAYLPTQEVIDWFMIEVRAALRAGRAAADAEIANARALPATHGSPDECPTYYDGCHCTVETLKHNIERADAESAALREEMGLLRLDCGGWKDSAEHYKAEVDRITAERDSALALLDAHGRESVATLAIKDRDRLEREVARLNAVNTSVMERNARLDDAAHQGLQDWRSLREQLDAARAGLKSVSGALMDAGTVPVPDEWTEYGDAVRRLIAERDAFDARLSRIHAAMGNECFTPEEALERLLEETMPNLRDELKLGAKLLREAKAENATMRGMVKRLVEEGDRLGWPDHHPPLVEARALLGGGGE